MDNHYEAFIQNILEQAAHDKRAQPWKNSVDTDAPAPVDEWVRINPHTAGNGEEMTDVRSNAFPVGPIEVRTNAFPVGPIEVRTNAFPVGPIEVRTNAFGPIEVRTNAFPV